MSLLDEVKKLEDSYNKKLESVARKEEKVAQRERDLAEIEAKLASEKESLDLKIEQNTSLVGKILQDEELKQKASDLEELQRQLRSGRADLRDWENRLYKIERNQEEREAKITADRIALDEAKENYKQEIKEQFFKELEAKVSKL